jgi:AraC family transcriptional regulator
MSDVGICPSGLPSSPLPIVEISPPDIARRRLAHWGATQADNVRVTCREAFEDGHATTSADWLTKRAERHDGGRR